MATPPRVNTARDAATVGYFCVRRRDADGALAATRQRLTPWAKHPSAAGPPAVPSESAASAPPAASAALLPTALRQHNPPRRGLATDVGLGCSSAIRAPSGSSPSGRRTRRRSRCRSSCSASARGQSRRRRSEVLVVDHRRARWRRSQRAAGRLCVVDGLLGEAAATTLRREVQAVRAAGGLALSKLAGGRTGKGLSYSHSAVRGDWVGWFDGDEQGHWAERSLSLPAASGHADVAARAAARRRARRRRLAVEGDGRRVPGGGARYVRHCDNACLAGEGRSAAAAARHLPQPGVARRRRWRAASLRAAGAKGRAARRRRRAAERPSRALRRLPRAARGARGYSDRLAITLWYFDGAERERAQQRGTAAAAATDAAEAAAITGEIERFEARFGAADEVRRVSPTRSRRSCEPHG